MRSENNIPFKFANSIHEVFGQEIAVKILDAAKYCEERKLQDKLKIASELCSKYDNKIKKYLTFNQKDSDKVVRYSNKLFGDALKDIFKTKNIYGKIKRDSATAKEYDFLKLLDNFDSQVDKYKKDQDRIDEKKERKWSDKEKDRKSLKNSVLKFFRR